MTEATAHSPALEPAATGEGWTRTRLFTVIALVTVVQVALIFLFGEKKEAVPRAVRNVAALKFANTAAAQLELLAMEDPTLFVLPNPKDFAAASWMKTYANPPQSFRWTEPPRWLPLSTDGLGTAFSRLMPTNSPTDQVSGFRPVPELTAPTTLDEPAPAQNSTMRIRGELAQRLLPSKISLTNWPYADVLAPCIVQVLVDTTGNVVSTVLLKSSSFKDADDKALEVSRSLRFAPAANLAFGRIIFNWQTVPPAASP